MYDGQERRLYTRRAIDSYNNKMLELLKEEVKALDEIVPLKLSVWICQRVMDNRILAVSYNRQDIVNFVKPQCQYFNITLETSEITRGHYRSKKNCEDFEFIIAQFKIHDNVPQPSL